MALFQPGTKRYLIAELQSRGMTEREAYSELRPKVADQVRPWVFTRNTADGRRPKPMSEQYVELQHEIARVYALIARTGESGIGTDEKPKPEPKPEAEKPKAKGKTKADEKRFFIDEWKRLRRWIAETAERTGALPIDSLDSMRPIQAAKHCIDAGISARTMLHAMTLHWPKVSREMAGIEDVDFIAESETVGEGFHALTGYVLRLMRASLAAELDPKSQGFGIMLIGPAGTGKSRLLKMAAKLIKTDAHPDGLPYAETPMTPGATRGDLLGRHTISGFVPSQFVEVYAGGGVFNFEEMDAADPSMLIVVNNALASDELYNSANGEVYKRHPDFIPVATANTFGLGADSKYTGREKLDLATIDRFRMGRVLVSLDESLAEFLMED